MANRDRPSRVGSTQSHQRRPEDHARATRGALRRSVIADHRSPPRTSVAVLHALPVFHEVSSSRMIFFSRHTVANRRGRPATVSRWSNEHDELCLFRTMRRTKVCAEGRFVEFQLQALHLHHRTCG